MSEPVKKEEVEGVLSSIRRLVGDAKAQTADEFEYEEDRSGLLVLTPQLRVVDSGEVLRLTPEHAVRSDETQPGLSEDATAFAPPVAASQTASSFSEEDEKPVEPERRDVSALSAKIAALETAIARTVGDWEPDGAGHDAYAGTQPPAITWREDVELDGHGAPLPPAQASADAAKMGSEADADVQILDEETLRDMVSQMIRDEFHGELGERITRNVRKLVRQEIQRALTARTAR